MLLRIEYIMSIKYKYNQYLTSITSNFHNSTTTNVELDKLCTALFSRSKFMGVYSIDTIKPYQANKSLIFNLDESDKPGSHWCAIYYIRNKIYIYDSFARKQSELLTKNKIKNTKAFKNKKYDLIFINKYSDQKGTEYNCGQRCAAWLCMVYFHGLEYAIHV